MTGDKDGTLQEVKLTGEGRGSGSPALARQGGWMLEVQVATDTRERW